jgi:toxin ParE1/3/4
MGRNKKTNQAIDMPHLVFHPALSSEIKASYDWYEDKANGLGDDFLSELELGFQAIIEYPDTWPVFTKCVRRFILSRFPYSILYQITPDKILVVAVMHNSRKPGYWLNRL